MKVSTLINILIIILMGHIFAPDIMRLLDTNRIPMFPINIFSRRYILLLLQGVLIVYRPKVLFEKPMRFVYLYYIVFFLFRISGYYDTTSQWFHKYHFTIFLSVLIYTYYLSRKDYKGLAIIGTTLLILILTSSLINLVQLILHPESAKAYGCFTGERQFGVFGYSLPSTLSFVLPVLFWSYKYLKISKSRKVFLFIGIIISYFSIFVSSITAPIIIASIGIIFAISGVRKFKNSIIISSVILLALLFIPRRFFPNLFYSASEIISNPGASLRLYSIGLGLEYGVDVYTPSTALEYRASRIPLNFNQFIKYPIFGKGVEGNAHLFWLNYLAQFGLIGTLSLVLILYNQFKMNMKIFSEDFKYYYLLSIFLFLFSGFVKAYSPLFFMMIILVVPSIYYIRYLNIKPNRKEHFSKKH